MNKKILSFIFGSLLVFSLFGAIEFQEVSAASISVNITTSANNYTQPYLNGNVMPVRVRFNFNITGTPSPSWTGVEIIAPAGFVLADKGVQPTSTGFTIDYASSDADGVLAAKKMVYTCNITSTGTRTINLDLVQVTAGEGPHTWTINNTGSNLSPLLLSPSVVVDNTKPTFTVSYSKTPNVAGVAPAPGTFGLGNITITIVANDPIIATPTISVKQQNKTLQNLTYTTSTTNPPAAGNFRSQSGGFPTTTLIGTYSITSTNGASDGLATVTINATDRAGNIGNTIIAGTTGLDGPTFVVDSQCDKPTLTLPANGAIEASDVTFTWNDITDAAAPVEYTLQYSTSSTFASNVYTRYTTSPTTSYLASGLTTGVWYWRVWATDSLGNLSGTPASHTTRSFTVSTPSSVPTFRVRYIKTPKIDYDDTPDVLGAGTMQISIRSSEILSARPTVQVKLHNQTTWTNLTVTGNAPGSLFTATYNIPTGSTNNGLAQITISGTSTSGNIGTAIDLPEWDASRVAPDYLPTELDSDGAFFYVSTTTDSPALNFPNNGYSVPGHQNVVDFKFNKITDLTSERPADPGQNNCITYNIQYSTNPDFTSNVITQSVDIDETALPSPVFCATGDALPYNNWTITGTIREHKSQSLANGTWFWRVWATDKLGNQSPYSETRQFSVSTVRPGLTSPTDLSLLNYNDPILTWGAVPTAISYNIRLSRGDNIFLNYTLYPDKIAVNGFTGGTSYDVSVSTPPTPPIGILEDGVWYWAVSSNLDSQAYSGTWRFTVDTTGPPAPSLLTLNDGQVSQNKRPTFTWSAISDTNDLSNPVRYYIQISGDPTFPGDLGPTDGTTAWPSPSTFDPNWLAATYQRGPLTSPTFTPTSDFPETLLTQPSNTYYWRVYAVDSAGNVGTNSLTRNFRVSTSPPLLWGDSPAGDNGTCETWPTGCFPIVTANRDQIALGLRSPSNGFTTNTRNPSLEWRHSRCDCVVREISSYIIQYSTDITFPPDKTTDIAGVFQVLGINPDNNLLLNMGYTIQTPLFNGTYFWRVCAVDTAGNRTQFTAPWSFTVNVPDNEQPATPQCSATIPCAAGFTCQAGVCVPVTLSPGNLTITVQNAGGTAISGATVTVDGTAQTTDAAGQVTFTALSGGSHTINNVTASGYTDYGTSTVSINGNTSQTITLTVPGTEGYVWGSVYFDAVGTAAPNVLIDIYNQSTDVKVDSRLTNSEGKFQSSPLPSTGTYYIKIPAYEKELRDLQPTSLTTGEKIVILETKGTVTGIVQDDSGQIVSSATVVLKKYPGEEFVDTKTTNTIGQFSFDALPGTYVVTISKAGYDAYTSSSFSVQSKQTVNLQSVLGNIVLNAIRGTLSVSVKDDKGATINTATVTIRSSTGAVVRSITTTNGVGTTQLAPGPYRVSAVASGFAESLQQSTNITSNQTSSVSITLAPATGSIRVAAKDAGGAPLAGASVYVDGVLSGITDSEGELLVTGLKLGTHTVRITKGGYSTVEEQVTSGESTVIVDTALSRSYLRY
ncbi:MAG: carboxypeptidase-like regulatory domain-containing protein, partial [Candidatus Methanofastidiosum sp.]|nr:carboxypeptidase-like regulatory domain-containing protein [Methanofastidiosum sp.]